MLRTCAVPLAVLALIAPGAASAQHDAQLWTSGSTQVALGDRLRVSQEVVARFSDRRDGLYEIESSTLIGYRLARGVTAWAGYTHDPNYEGGRFTVMEHRVRTQVTVDEVAHIAGGTLSGRLRMEQRWREGIGGTAWRVRPFVRFRLPLGRTSPAALVLSHESFIDLNETSFQRVEGEERMRNLVALSLRVARPLTLEVGYLNQRAFRPGAADPTDHALSLALGASF